MDALVRCVRTDRRSAERVALSLLDQWQKTPNARLRIEEGDLLFVDARLAHREEAAGWIFSAFMAGLRSIGFSAQLTGAELVTLADALAALTPTAEASRAFADWCFEFSTSGPLLVVASSFSEMVSEGESRSRAESFSIAALRSSGATSLLAEISVAAADIDRASARADMDVSGLYEKKLGERAFEVDGATLKALVAETNDAFAWADAELDVLLMEPELRASVSANRVASAIAARLAAGLTAELLASALGMEVSALPADRAVGTALSSLLPDAVARGGAKLRENGAMHALLNDFSPARKGATLRALAAMAAGDSGARAALGAWVQADAQHLLVALDGVPRTEDAFASMVPAFYAALGAPALLAWVQTQSSSERAMVLDLLSPTELVAAAFVVCTLAKEGHAMMPTFLLRLLDVEGGSDVVFDALRALPAADETLLRATFVTFARSRPGQERLVLLVRDRKARLALRLFALTQLTGTGECERLATRFRFAEWWMPAPLATAIRSHRKRLRDDHSATPKGHS